jgi:asparagine synthase (glutamine-hydrolysing)
MCGITGYFAVDPGQAQRLAAELPAATAAIANRGPDGQGLWTTDDKTVGFGHRRLAIIDLTDHAAQPMHSRCGQWSMVFNGEVYNFGDIREELVKLGHGFSGTGDSEVILAAFSQWGVEACTRFTGMFAIALWHQPTRQLHLLRDRLGVKPMIYHWDGRTLMFGSEMKALQAFSGWPREIDRDSLADYLRYGYIADPRSIFRNVFKLPPAHRLVIGSDGKTTLTRYWNAADHVGQRVGRPEEELVDELEALMTDAFSLRMIADVPVGVFLSGGLDSSVLAAVLKTRAHHDIKTFTIGFDVEAYNEAPYAEAIARHLGTEQVTRILRVDDALRILPRWGELYDEPFADESGIATLMVSQAAAEQVKVVLSADGGDELFAGYNSYSGILDKWQRIKGLPLPLRRSMRGVLGQDGEGGLIDRLAGARGARALFGARRFLDARHASDLFQRALTIFDAREMAALIGVTSPDERAIAADYPGSDGEQLCLWDLHHYMPGDILTKVDRATMAAGIEGREPLIDHRLVEFAFSLPFHLRMGALGPKHLLRRVLFRHVPRELVERPKRGFAVPVKPWLHKELRPLVAQMLDPDRLKAQGIFDADAVQDYLRRLDQGDAGVRQKVWYLLAFQMWHQRWFPAPSSAGTSRAALPEASLAVAP